MKNSRIIFSFTLWLFFFSGLIFAEESPTKTVPVDPDLVVLLSDIHIMPKDFALEYARHNDRKLAKDLARIVEMNPRPAHVLIFGDFSFNDGLTEDYRLVRDLLKKLDDAGIPWIGTMGNHDNYANFIKIFPEKKDPQGLEGKAATVVELEQAVFILLDSDLDGSVRGAIDQKQIDWLKSKLERYGNSGKQIFVGAHHPINDLSCRKELGAILRQTPQVQGWLFGHSHRWTMFLDYGVRVFNIPSTAYISRQVAESPSPDDWPLGFMTLKIGRDFDIFTLLTNRPEHRLNGAQWRVPVQNDSSK